MATFTIIIAFRYQVHVRFRAPPVKRVENLPTGEVQRWKNFSLMFNNTIILGTLLLIWT